MMFQFICAISGFDVPLFEFPHLLRVAARSANGIYKDAGNASSLTSSQVSYLRLRLLLEPTFIECVYREIGSFPSSCRSSNNLPMPKMSIISCFIQIITMSISFHRLSFSAALRVLEIWMMQDKELLTERRSLSLFNEHFNREIVSKRRAKRIKEDYY